MDVIFFQLYATRWRTFYSGLYYNPPCTVGHKVKPHYYSPVTKPAVLNLFLKRIPGRCHPPPVLLLDDVTLGLWPPRSWLSAPVTVGAQQLTPGVELVTKCGVGNDPQTPEAAFACSDLVWPLCPSWIKRGCRIGLLRGPQSRFKLFLCPWSGLNLQRSAQDDAVLWTGF